MRPAVRTWKHPQAPAPKEPSAVRISDTQPEAETLSQPDLDDLITPLQEVDASSMCRCPICKKVYRAPVICTVCGRSYCSKCLDTHCVRNALCQSSEPLRLANKHLRKLLRGLRQHCPHAKVFDSAEGKWQQDEDGCPFIGRRDEVEQHQGQCDYRQVSCKRCQLSVRERDLSDHAADCEMDCSLCGDRILYKDYVAHLNESCLDSSCRCPNEGCVFAGSRRELPQHLDRYSQELTCVKLEVEADEQENASLQLFPDGQFSDAAVQDDSQQDGEQEVVHQSRESPDGGETDHQQHRQSPSRDTESVGYEQSPTDEDIELGTWLRGSKERLAGSQADVPLCNNTKSNEREHHAAKQPSRSAKSGRGSEESSKPLHGNLRTLDKGSAGNPMQAPLKTEVQELRLAKVEQENSFVTEASRDAEAGEIPHFVNEHFGTRSWAKCATSSQMEAPRNSPEAPQTPHAETDALPSMSGRSAETAGEKQATVPLRRKRSFPGSGNQVSGVKKRKQKGGQIAQWMASKQILLQIPKAESPKGQSAKVPKVESPNGKQAFRGKQTPVLKGKLKPSKLERVDPEMEADFEHEETASKTRPLDCLPKDELEQVLDDLLHRPEKWPALDQLIGGKKAFERLVLPLDQLIRERGPETYRKALKQSASKLDRSAFESLHCNLLRFLFFILRGKTDIRAKKLTIDFLLREVQKALGIIRPDEELDCPKAKGVKRPKEESDEEDDFPLFAVKIPKYNPAPVAPASVTSRQKRQKVKSIMQRILEKLVKGEVAEDFYMPITDDVAPDYSKIIKRPLCLLDVLNKIEWSDFYTLDALRSDIELIRSNAHTYCTDRFPEVVGRADQLSELFLSELDANAGDIAQAEAL